MFECRSDSVVARRIACRIATLRCTLAIFVLGWTMLLGACSGDSGSGPVAVKWDRVTCERCRMVLSDRRHAAQMRIPKSDGKSEVLFFDDIGCALIWLDGQPPEVRESPSTEIWVTDWRTGDWIDARAATYVPGQVTPMGYGLGAQPEPAESGMDFAQIKKHVIEVERRFNSHDAHPDAASSVGSRQ